MEDQSFVNAVLPLDCFVELVPYLRLQDLMEFSRVCRAFCEIVDDFYHLIQHEDGTDLFAAPSMTRRYFSPSIYSVCRTYSDFAKRITFTAVLPHHIVEYSWLNFSWYVHKYEATHWLRREERLEVRSDDYFMASTAKYADNKVLIRFHKTGWTAMFNLEETVKGWKIILPDGFDERGICDDMVLAKIEDYLQEALYLLNHV